MKQNLTRIVYWGSTTVFSLMMVFSAYQYLTSPEMEGAFTHLGFPAYFRVELAIAKFLGAAALLLPVSARLKEWAYAGFTFNLISAVVAHAALGDPAKYTLMPVVFLAVLSVSYVTKNAGPLSLPSQLARA